MCIRDRQQAKASFVKREANKLKRYICSAQKKVCLDGQITLIGERINPSGNKGLKEQFVAGNPLAAIKVAFEQVQKGADVLDVNTSLPMIDETDYMTKIIDGLSGLVEAPLQFAQLAQAPRARLLVQAQFLALQRTHAERVVPSPAHPADLRAPGGVFPLVAGRSFACIALISARVRLWWYSLTTSRTCAPAE